VRQLVTRNVLAAALARYFANGMDAAGGVCAGGGEGRDGGDAQIHAPPGWCKLKLSNPVLKGPSRVPALETGISNTAFNVCFHFQRAPLHLAPCPASPDPAAAPGGAEQLPPLPPVGPRVRCENLTNAVELNGRMGYVTVHRSGGERATVRVNIGTGGGACQMLSLTTLENHANELDERSGIKMRRMTYPA
jgi:hypothetical protein